mgnify:CR=1 FL=1
MKYSRKIQPKKNKTKTTGKLTKRKPRKEKKKKKRKPSFTETTNFGKPKKRPLREKFEDEADYLQFLAEADSDDEDLVAEFQRCAEEDELMEGGADGDNTGRFRFKPKGMSLGRFSERARNADKIEIPFVIEVKYPKPNDINKTCVILNSNHHLNHSPLYIVYFELISQNNVTNIFLNRYFDFYNRRTGRDGGLNIMANIASVGKLNTKAKDTQFNKVNQACSRKMANLITSCYPKLFYKNLKSIYDIFNNKNYKNHYLWNSTLTVYLKSLLPKINIDSDTELQANITITNKPEDIGYMTPSQLQFSDDTDDNTKKILNLYTSIKIIIVSEILKKFRISFISLKSILDNSNNKRLYNIIKGKEKNKDNFRDLKNQKFLYPILSNFNEDEFKLDFQIDKSGNTDSTTTYTVNDHNYFDDEELFKSKSNYKIRKIGAQSTLGIGNVFKTDSGTDQTRNVYGIVSYHIRRKIRTKHTEGASLDCSRKLNIFDIFDRSKNIKHITDVIHQFVSEIYLDTYNSNIPISWLLNKTNIQNYNNKTNIYLNRFRKILKHISKPNNIDIIDSFISDIYKLILKDLLLVDMEDEKFLSVPSKASSVLGVGEEVSYEKLKIKATKLQELLNEHLYTELQSDSSKDLLSKKKLNLESKDPKNVQLSQDADQALKQKRDNSFAGGESNSDSLIRIFKSPYGKINAEKQVVKQYGRPYITKENVFLKYSKSLNNGDKCDKNTMIKKDFKNKNKNTGNQLDKKKYSTKYNWVSPHILTGATEKRNIAKIGYGDREQYKFVVSNYSIYNTFGYEFNNHIIFRSTYDNQSGTGLGRDHLKPSQAPKETPPKNGGNDVMSDKEGVPRGMSFMLESLFNEKLIDKNNNNFTEIRNNEYGKLENGLLDVTDPNFKIKTTNKLLWKTNFISNLFNNEINSKYKVQFKNKSFLDS